MKFDLPQISVSEAHSKPKKGEALLVEIMERAVALLSGFALMEPVVLGSWDILKIFMLAASIYLMARGLIPKKRIK